MYTFVYLGTRHENNGGGWNQRMDVEVTEHLGEVVVPGCREDNSEE